MLHILALVQQEGGHQQHFTTLYYKRLRTKQEWSGVAHPNQITGLH